ncbi:hypothetical protein [Nocardioides panacisoli]|uniref:Uncharacterized protein n=1 Tax=Nocardioides panacisoli TaxID=627624 RepID=A0ABP7J337_9ACTN
MKFEPRRYSAVLLAADRSLTARQLLMALDCERSGIKPVTPIGEWSVGAGTVRVRANYSRSSRAVADDDGLYPHRVFVADATIDGRPYHLVASPYVRFLAKCLKRLDDSRPMPLIYFKPSMSDVFSHFETTRPTRLAATRISVLMEGDVGLEIVSLSGRNPLRSDLRHALLGVASPYAIRVKGTFIEKRPVNIHADRHGNIWCHLGSEEALINMAAFASVMIRNGHLAPTSSSPLLRLPGEDSDL